jgi:hypothetical protein
MLIVSTVISVLSWRLDFDITSLGFDYDVLFLTEYKPLIAFVIAFITYALARARA